MALAALLAVAVLAGAPAAAQEVDPAAVVGEASFPARLTTEPGRIVLGEVDRVVFRIDAEEPEGPLRPLRASVNVGRLAEVERTAAGRYQVAYEPPSKRYPQVAIVAVWRETGPDAPVAFFRVPLLGTARVPVETEPRATVTVGVGRARFGPVKADGRGHAVVRLVVPPGVPRARITARTEGGKTTSTALSLGVPPYNRITVAVVPHTLTADGVSEARLHLYYDAVGHRPPPAERVRIDAPVGEVRRVVHRRGPLYTATYVAPPGTPDQQVVFTARIRGDRRSVAEAAVQLGRQVPDRVEIDAGRELLADGEDRTEVRITVLDALGLGVPGVEVKVASGGDAGLRIEPVEALGEGSYRTFVAAPRIVRGEPSEVPLLVTAGGLSGRAAIRLVPNLPARIEVAPPTLNLVADGSATAVFRVRVLDAAGRPIVGRPPGVLGAADGEVVLSEPDEDGVFPVRYRPRSWVHETWVDEAAPSREIALRFRAGPAEEAARVQVTATVRSLVTGQGFVELLGGWQPPAGGLAGLSATASAGVAVLQRGRLSVAAGLRTGVTDLRGDLPLSNDLGEAGRLRLHLLAVPVLAQAQAGYRLGSDWLVGLALEGGVVLTPGSARVAGSGDLPLGGLGPAFGARAFAGRRLGPGLVVLHAGWLQAVPPASGAVRLTGNVGGPVGVLGYRLEL